MTEREDGENRKKGWVYSPHTPNFFSYTFLEYRRIHYPLNTCEDIGRRGWWWCQPQCWDSEEGGKGETVTRSTRQCEKATRSREGIR